MATPPAEVFVDTRLVRALLAEQHADLSHLPLTPVAQGWDNAVFRLGDALAVRLPRRSASSRLIEHEQRWLSVLAPRLPLAVPAPIRMGRPGCGFPWSWSVTPWLPGSTAAVSPPRDWTEATYALVGFLKALHTPAPADAPHNPWRSVPLANRTTALREHLNRLDGSPTEARVLAAWDQLVRTPPWTRPPSWIHGDLHPGNLLCSDGCLSGVIDFGDLAAGDPATDISVAWMLLPAPERELFRQLACGPDGWLDRATWNRGRGWALALGVAYTAIADDNPVMTAIGRATIDAVLDA